MDVSGGMRAAADCVSHVALCSVAQLWLAIVRHCPISRGTEWVICRGNAVASEEFTRLRGGSHPALLPACRVCTILDLHSEATSHCATWPWCPCPQLNLELDYLEGAFQLTPFQPSDSMPYRCSAKPVLCLGTLDLAVLHLKLHLHLIRLQHLLRAGLAVCRKPQMKSSSHCPPVNSWSSVV